MIATLGGGDIVNESYQGKGGFICGNTITYIRKKKLGGAERSFGHNAGNVGILDSYTG